MSAGIASEPACSKIWLSAGKGANRQTTSAAEQAEAVEQPKPLTKHPWRRTNMKARMAQTGTNTRS
jgi:hypothetical protein